MQSFDYLLTTKPHDICAVFVSDLHLSNNTPRLNHAFIALIKDLMVLPNLQALYILGDWLNSWIGDDDYLSLSKSEKQSHWLTPIINTLKALNQKTLNQKNSQTTQIYIMHGNRDFMIGQKLCDEFGGQLIHEPFYIRNSDIYGNNIDNSQIIRLEHGDKLCTDDVQYQRYRKIIRNPIILWLLKKQPLNKRRQLANNIKHQSTHNKTQKSLAIMDVNHQAVGKAMQDCTLLIHGHTHRPASHDMGDKKRLVLGDWRDDNGKTGGVIGVIDSEDVALWEFVANI